MSLPPHVPSPVALQNNDDKVCCVFVRNFLHLGQHPQHSNSAIPSIGNAHASRPPWIPDGTLESLSNRQHRRASAIESSLLPTTRCLCPESSTLRLMSAALKRRDLLDRQGPRGSPSLDPGRRHRVPIKLTAPLGEHNQTITPPDDETFVDTSCSERPMLQLRRRYAPIHTSHLRAATVDVGTTTIEGSLAGHLVLKSGPFALLLGTCFLTPSFASARSLAHPC